jgi:hypothetical protein
VLLLVAACGVAALAGMALVAAVLRDGARGGVMLGRFGEDGRNRASSCKLWPGWVNTWIKLGMKEEALRWRTLDEARLAAQVVLSGGFVRTPSPGKNIKPIPPPLVFCNISALHRAQYG